LRALLARYFERMKAIIESQGGTVEQFIGDAVMAVFGIPAAMTGLSAKTGPRASSGGSNCHAEPARCKQKVETGKRPRETNPRRTEKPPISGGFRSG
jgi:class 3 adenylate cyclase